MGRFPVDVTTILVGIHVALAIVACLLVAAGGGGLLDLMMFDSARVLGSGQVWRLATYAFIHSPMQLLWFAIEMYMLFVFGREVEKFIGQRAYIVPVVWTSIAASFCFVRLRGVGPELIWRENFKARLQPKPKFKVVPEPVPTRREDDISESVDPILDKIAKSGIGSLTPSERRTLDRHREGDLVDQSGAGVRKSDAVFDQGGVYSFACQDQREKFCRLQHTPGFFKKTNDLA